MRSNRKGFTLIELLIVVVIVGILALAAIPLITSNTRDARRSEGEQMMGSMKGQARVAFAKNGAAPTTLVGPIDTGGSGVSAGELTGQYYTVTDAVAAGTGFDASISATANNGTDGTGTHNFDWAGGNGDFVWP